MRDLNSFAWSGRRAKSACVAIVALVVYLVETQSAFAEASAEDKQKARAAYNRATEANERGDFAVAARELALADELVPNVVTLTAALDAASDADTPVMAMELVVRAESRGEAVVAASARKRFSGRVGRLQVVCAEAAPCTAKLDGAEFAVSQERFVLAGKHTVIVTSEGHSITREVDIAPMALAIVQASSANVSPHVSPPSTSGLSPAWFVTGFVSTVAAGIGTAISGAGTMKLHDEFLSAHCSDPGPASACSGLASDGQSAQVRTNVLVGVTAALGLSTVILGVVTFGKKNPSLGPVSAMSIEPRPDGVFARLVLGLP